MGNNKRREFLKKSVLGITGATLLQGNARSTESRGCQAGKDC